LSVSISIVTPSLNQAQYLETTIQSVLCRRPGEVEYVVVDGGSTDGSVDIIRRYADELTWWVSEPDAGYADAINKGFAHTSGEIMGWINSSDLYLPWTLSVVGEVFASFPSVDWITGAPCMAGSDGVLRATGLTRVNRHDFLCGAHGIQQESTFWRRGLWEAAGGLDASMRYAADYELWTRFFAHAQLHSVDCALAAFRVHDVRLGEPANDAYGIEARRSRHKMMDGATARDRRRARIVRWAHRAAGQLGGPILEVCPGCGWYRHPQIVYAFEAGTWKQHTRRRIGGLI